MASLLGLLLLFNAFGIVVEYRTSSAPWDVITGDLVNRAEEGDGFLRCSGPVSALKPYYQELEVPGAHRYYRDKEGMVQPPGLSQHDRLWVLDRDDGCSRRGHLEIWTETPCWEEGFGHGGRREQNEGPNLPKPRGPGIGGGVAHASGQGAAGAGGGSSIGRSLRTETIRSAFDFVPARLCQILTLALLALASLPKYISTDKAFRPDF